MHIMTRLAAAAAALFLTASPAHGDDYDDRDMMSRTDTYTVSAASVERLRLADISFSDMTYTAVPGATEFSVTLTRKVKTDDSAEFEDMIERINLDIRESDGEVTMRLDNPGSRSRGWFGRGARKWRVQLAITGPAALDSDIDISFSDAEITGLEGAMRLDVSFADVTLRDLRGSINANNSFGECTVNFARLDDDSRLSTSFGAIDLHLPANTDAVFTVDKSLGEVDFKTRDAVRYRDRSSSSSDGLTVALSASMGSITVRDDQPGQAARPVGSTRMASSERGSLRRGIMPLMEGAWWSYTAGADSITLRVHTLTVDRDGTRANLRFEPGTPGPFDMIDIVDTTAGLHLARIGGGGHFFGGPIAGKGGYLVLTPPRLWLPYDDVTHIKDDVLGSVAATETTDFFETPAGVFANARRYTMTNLDGVTHTIVLVPGTGIVAFDDWLLSARGGAVTEMAARAERKPVPRFSEGTLTKLSINIIGDRMLDRDDVAEALPLTVGTTYTRDEIAAAVDSLTSANRFIKNAWFSITLDGALTVNVRERELMTRDLEPAASFTRVGGVGLGPRVTITSLVGPISNIDAEARYNFSSEEWVGKVRAEKRLFDNILSVGGTWHEDYLSTMDWALPDVDAQLNAFILGLDTTNYVKARGGTGYVQLAPIRGARIRAEYFRDDYETVKKNTNWSLFNHRHKKDDVLPLTPIDEGGLAGMRIHADIDRRTRFSSTSLTLEAERSIDEGTDIYAGDYTRFFGNARTTWRLTPGDMLSIRLAGGYSDDVLPAVRSFRLGGPTTLRGFTYESVPSVPMFTFLYGGSRMALMNVEYYFGIPHNDFSFVAFADAGGVWLDEWEVDLADVKRDVGLGILLGDNIFFNEITENLDWSGDDVEDGLSVNWAVPVGPEPHVSRWTVTFTRAY